MIIIHARFHVAIKNKLKTHEFQDGNNQPNYS